MANQKHVPQLCWYRLVEKSSISMQIHCYFITFYKRNTDYLTKNWTAGINKRNHKVVFKTYMAREKKKKKKVLARTFVYIFVLWVGNIFNVVQNQQNSSSSIILEKNHRRTKRANQRTSEKNREKAATLWKEQRLFSIDFYIRIYCARWRIYVKHFMHYACTTCTGWGLNVVFMPFSFLKLQLFAAMAIIVMGFFINSKDFISSCRFFFNIILNKM